MAKTVDIYVPPGSTPTMQLYNANSTVGSPIACTATINPCIVRFDLTAVAVGDYTFRLSAPLGAGRVLITNDSAIKYSEPRDLTQVIVSPTAGLGAQDFTTQELDAPTDADFVLVRTVVDRDGDPITLPSGCYFVLTDEYEVHLIDLVPAINGSTYSVTIPRDYTQLQRTLNFALRSTSTDNQPYDLGTIRFLYAATEAIG